MFNIKENFMEQIQFIQTTPEQQQEAILKGVKAQFEDLKKHFQPREPEEYLTRNEVCAMFKITLTSVHNWTKKGVLTAHQISGRVYYKRSQIDAAIVELKR